MNFLKKAWTIFETVEEKLANFGAMLSALYIFVAAVGISIAALGRYIFNFNIPGVDELSGYMLVFATYMGLAYGLRTESHISIDIVLSKLNRKLVNRIWVLSCIIALCVIGIYLYYATISLIESIQLQEKALTLLQTPLWVPRSFICIGWILMSLSMIRVLVSKVQALR